MWDAQNQAHKDSHTQSEIPQASSVVHLSSTALKPHYWRVTACICPDPCIHTSIQILYLLWHRKSTSKERVMLTALWAAWRISWWSLSVFVFRDGLISKDEMMAYFLRANPLLQCKMGPGFIHNFQEMTYLKPTFCEHCAGFVRADRTTKFTTFLSHQHMYFERFLLCNTYAKILFVTKVQ